MLKDAGTVAVRLPTVNLYMRLFSICTHTLSTNLLFMVVWDGRPTFKVDGPTKEVEFSDL